MSFILDAITSLLSVFYNVLFFGFAFAGGILTPMATFGTAMLLGLTLVWTFCDSQTMDICLHGEQKAKGAGHASQETTRATQDTTAPSNTTANPASAPNPREKEPTGVEALKGLCVLCPLACVVLEIAHTLQWADDKETTYSFAGLLMGFVRAYVSVMSPVLAFAVLVALVWGFINGCRYCFCGWRPRKAKKVVDEERSAVANLEVAGGNAVGQACGDDTTAGAAEVRAKATNEEGVKTEARA